MITIKVGTMVRVIGTTSPEMTCEAANEDGTYLCGWWSDASEYFSETYNEDQLELV